MNKITKNNQNLRYLAKRPHDVDRRAYRRGLSASSDDMIVVRKSVKEIVNHALEPITASARIDFEDILKKTVKPPIVSTPAPSMGSALRAKIIGSAVFAKTMITRSSKLISKMSEEDKEQFTIKRVNLQALRKQKEAEAKIIKEQEQYNYNELLQEEEQRQKVAQIIENSEPWYSKEHSKELNKEQNKDLAENNNNVPRGTNLQVKSINNSDEKNKLDEIIVETLKPGIVTSKTERKEFSNSDDFGKPSKLFGNYKKIPEINTEIQIQKKSEPLPSIVDYHPQEDNTIEIMKKYLPVDSDNDISKEDTDPEIPYSTLARQERVKQILDQPVQEEIKQIKENILNPEQNPKTNIEIEAVSKKPNLKDVIEQEIINSEPTPIVAEPDVVSSGMISSETLKPEVTEIKEAENSNQEKQENQVPAWKKYILENNDN
ncbi:MAG: hypothetical protein LBM13_04110 [Candidatus Ancillula sp.]|jgi:hypothetical protein|nr:hypothetical protein [Candidatus Ancillula sp.]